MPLIVKGTVFKFSGVLPDRSTKFFVNVPSDYLSGPYDLSDNDEIKGEIIDAWKGEEEYRDLRGKTITLILKKSEAMDSLFISDDSWKPLFREKGLVMPGYKLYIKLTEAISKSTNGPIKLYTEKDVTCTHTNDQKSTR